MADPRPRERGRAYAERARVYRAAGDEANCVAYAARARRIAGDAGYRLDETRFAGIAAELVRAGVNVSELAKKMYESYPRRRLELLRALLNTLRFSSSDRAASVGLRRGIRARGNRSLLCGQDTRDQDCACSNQRQNHRRYITFHCNLLFE